MRSRWIRVLLAASVLLSLDALVALVWFLPGGASQAHAPEETPRTASSLRNDVLQEIGREIEARRRAIAEHEERLLEILRSEEVLRRARAFLDDGDDEAETETGGADSAPATASSAPVRVSPEGQDAFVRLQRAYENMEPDSAARALEALAAKDQEAVVELLLGWKPRTSGAILDAIAQNNASLAAELSYEIWKRRQGSAGKAATPRR